jgi:hypothetical protein
MKAACFVGILLMAAACGGVVNGIDPNGGSGSGSGSSQGSGSASGTGTGWETGTGTGWGTGTGTGWGTGTGTGWGTGTGTGSCVEIDTQAGDFACVLDSDCTTQVGQAVLCSGGPACDTGAVTAMSTAAAARIAEEASAVSEGACNDLFQPGSFPGSVYCLNGTCSFGSGSGTGWSQCSGNPPYCVGSCGEYVEAFCDGSGNWACPGEPPCDPIDAGAPDASFGEADGGIILPPPSTHN